MLSNPDLSVIIVSYNTREILRACLDKVLQAGEGMNMQVIVVDNASRDGSAEMVQQDFPTIQVIASDINLGFAAGNNLGFKHASGRYIVLLNPDAMLPTDALQVAMQHMEENPDAGMGGARLLGRTGKLEPSARKFPSLLNEILVISGLAARFPGSRFFGRFDRSWDDPERPAKVDWVPGAFAIIRKSALLEIGEFDERFFLYYEEVDLCRRFNNGGWGIWYWPDIIVRHWGGESSKTVEHVEFSSSGSQLTLWRMRSALLYYRKHHGAISTWLVSQLEMSWHLIRKIKARMDGNVAKSEDSARVVSLMLRAWRETMGGLISPPRPW